MRPSGLQSRFERGGEEKNSQPLPLLKPPIFQPVAQRRTTELFWLSFMSLYEAVFVSLHEIHETKHVMDVSVSPYVSTPKLLDEFR
jgi:hypothetical protein